MRNVVMAAMLVAAGVTSSFVPKTGGSDSPAEAELKGRPAVLQGALPQPIDDPRELLEDFINPSETPAKEGLCPDPIDRLRELLIAPPRACIAPAVRKTAQATDHNDWDIKFMIATIPDPERTHLSLYFDRFLEAIINAAEDSGYSYDRHWLPWHVTHDPPNPDPAKQDVLDGRAEAQHRKPGVIIFRKSARRLTKAAKKDYHHAVVESEDDFAQIEKTALVIFLVGETPTSGISRHQFANAVDFMRDFKPNFSGVLGPTFTGSSASLRAALRASFGDQKQRVISGAVSSRRALAGLGESTVHTDASLKDALGEVLKNQLQIRGRIAVLKEAATDFGSHLGVSKFESKGTIDIGYPREISRLRNVYPEQTNSAAAQVANAQQQLLLRLRDSRAGEDTLPQFSDQTPLTQESVLLQISQTLRRERVGLAIVTGTDVLDLLFLSRHLAALSPDVRLLLWDSDLLFVHGTDTLDFSGMLALSTYPLVPANQSWTEPQGVENTPLRQLYFADNTTEGVYNACGLLLTGSPIREYVSPGKIGSGPPVWLSVIGHDAYWPIGLIDDAGALPPMVRATNVNASGLHPGLPARSWSFTFYASSALASLYIGLFFYVLEKPLRRLPRWCSFIRPNLYEGCPGYADTDSPWRADYCFFLTMAILFSYLCVFFPVVRLGFGGFGEEWAWMLILGAIVVIGFLVVLMRGRRWAKTWMAVPVIVLGCLAAASLTYFWVRGIASREPQSFFRALRAVQLGSGVGPNVPLLFLFLAFAWWTFIQIHRARLVAEQRTHLPDVISGRAATNVRRINGWLAQPFLYIDRFGVGIGASVAVAAGIVSYLHVISIDGRLFDAAICGLLIFLSALLFLTTYAFAAIWWTLEGLLDALEEEPIRFAFSNLPADVSWSPLWQSGARKKSYTTLIRSLESLRALRDVKADYYPDLSDNINVLQTEIAETLKPVNDGVDESIEKMRDTQILLSQIAEKLSTKLKLNEWKTNHSESLEKLKKASGGKTVHHGGAKWLHPGKLEDVKITSTPEDAAPANKPDLLAAEIIALRFLAYIRYVMRHLLNLLSFLSTGFILLTLALNSYPFQMLSLIRLSITVVFLVVGVVIAYAFQRMGRNEILKRVTDTTGTVDKGFYTRAISIGALPLLAVVASHFPSIGRFLFSWVQPAIAALH